VQVILGAGLSGLSLAVALVRAGVRDDIVLVDQRTAFERDRTWCFWDVPNLPFRELATHSWPQWDVVTPTGRARGASAERPYLHVPADAFYAAALEELDRAPQVELRLGQRVLEIGDGWARTSGGRLEGTVHDGLALGSPALSRLEIEFWQTFLGWEVRTDDARFDPGTATLMDFRVDQSDNGVSFLYVLPFAPDHALVEHTTFGRGRVPRHKREKALAAFLGDGHEVVRTERGRLPMTTQRLPAARSPRTTAIGTAGGALRASSGYAFVRVQAHSAALARAIAAGAPAPRRAGRPRRALLDAVFLHALALHGEDFPEYFRTLVERVPGDVFARFMTDRSTAADEAAVMRALPAGPFAWAAVRAAVASRA
jgi:lycopene beta-cyclase